MNKCKQRRRSTAEQCRLVLVGTVKFRFSYNFSFSRLNRVAFMFAYSVTGLNVILIQSVGIYGIQ